MNRSVGIWGTLGKSGTAVGIAAASPSSTAKEMARHFQLSWH